MVTRIPFPPSHLFEVILTVALIVIFFRSAFDTTKVTPLISTLKNCRSGLKFAPSTCSVTFPFLSIVTPGRNLHTAGQRQFGLCTGHTQGAQMGGTKTTTLHPEWLTTSRACELPTDNNNNSAARNEATKTRPQYAISNDEQCKRSTAKCQTWITAAGYIQERPVPPERSKAVRVVDKTICVTCYWDLVRTCLLLFLLIVKVWLSCDIKLLLAKFRGPVTADAFKFWAHAWNF